MPETAELAARTKLGHGRNARSAALAAATVAMTVILLALPQALDNFLLGVAILILFWSYMGTAWNVLGGYAGQFSFGHAAFYGIGAYTSTWLLVKLGVNPWVGMIIGGLLAMAFGLLIGSLTWRYGIKGPYFALATFAFAEMLRLWANNWDVVNKSRGLQIPLIGGNSWSAFQFEADKRPYYYIILGLLFVSLFVTFFLSRSKAGYYLQAIRENEDAAAALGVNLMRYKLLAMSISAFLTALGGTFYAQYLFFIDPDIVFGPNVSVEILLRPILGGAGTVLGPLVGGVVLTPLSELTRAVFRDPPFFLPFLLALKGRVGVDMMLFGAILVFVIVFLPEGLVGWIRERRRLWRRMARG
ncbi:MAG: branched-chain amino acid ABC transporter permease [Chloroflexota bacterium]